MQNGLPIAVRLPLAVLLLAGVAACGDPQEYTVPSKACDRDVSKDELGALLPSGAELSDEPWVSDNSFSCQIYVDGLMQFAFTEHSGQRKFDVSAYAKSGRLGNFDQLRASDVSDNAVVSHTRSVVMAPCPKAGKNYILNLDLPNTDGDHSDDIERFVRSYLPTGLAAMGC
ncbi:hypothetical protein K7395_20940 [Streptomyces filamentosus]|uniref:DUF3558 domain-containing protein n=2 Tax=Streptomyces filamentosus TaxID=67294 RepID=A0ABY4UY03_STRFL|nr:MULTISPECIES: hypothetical protein [Streptomyces]EFE75340.1 predicted protein [Streptomyces filamentosus NRRL 15998]ESU48682.1 hypothetical protein P376_3336 [Streptomyces sp. HCCB10043]EWS92394.1 hypothetical protein SSIG_02903 [Streptomyces filamentosus NRRL 11379]MYR79413.1 hypothetical protein [Streptomyces sp. SID5466]USC49014.1 hypothetical protein K7395_20940 [Streptomyces filamentosus]